MSYNLSNGFGLWGGSSSQADKDAMNDTSEAATGTGAVKFDPTTQAYVWADGPSAGQSVSPTVFRTLDPSKIDDSADPGMHPPAAADAAPSVQDIANQTMQDFGVGPYATKTPAQSLSDVTAQRAATTPVRTVAAVGLPAAYSTRPRTLNVQLTPDQASALAHPAADTNPYTDPGSQAPKVDTSKVDATIAGVNDAISGLMGLANTSPETSVAEAQLMKADQLARLRDQQGLQNSQAAALGAARSGNRRDRALAERNAIGESTYLGQEAQRQGVLQDAELSGNLAQLRATEERNDIATRADIYKKAGDLGLNTAALDVDIGKTDVASANNWINDEFQQLGIDKQIKQEETSSALQFVQGMALIQFDYDKLSQDEKDHADEMMMQRYGIDQSTMVALKQIQASQHINWGQLLINIVSGFTQGGTMAVGSKLLK